MVRREGRDSSGAATSAAQESSASARGAIDDSSIESDHVFERVERRGEELDVADAAISFDSGELDRSKHD
jgi:hypothetical protein